MYKRIYQFPFSLIANIKKSISFNFLERKLISTGIFIKKSENNIFFLKKKLIEPICIIHITKNKKYTSYKEISIIVINVFLKKIIIQPNEKLGILDIVKNVKIKWEKSSILNSSVRGSNSFGSTGI
ncbi:dUTP diphosphatase [Blattabacterium sp. DPU]|uniref:dUTP diphosphatase n=1 Tax=Blattabacterium sp. DPU TaxID=2715232 RepID=UPI001408B91B|nr:dUTP diphosphatase [Blattabacterium sp. DPU]QIK16415.1 dUTP diphosphatase [Blattabacterium sp. DPU]